MGIPSIIDIVNVAFDVYFYILFARIILSWIKHNPYQPIIRFIYETTEPVLGLFRKIIPPLGVVDISPIAAFFVLQLVRQLVISILRAIM
ncbi:YggT family protein [Desulfolucanica intricata]|uniref:YggT family protein n=1 Tax=Desulfolucanica intricata TaxID=1285191 RepID=UPI000A6DD16A|nr:YggT family protein [Desulfolucanica intricata]